MLYRGRNPEPEPPGKQKINKKSVLTRRTVEQDPTYKEEHLKAGISKGEKGDRTERIRDRERLRNKYANIGNVIQHRQMLAVDPGFVRDRDPCRKIQREREEGERGTKHKEDWTPIPVRRKGGEEVREQRRWLVLRSAASEGL